jgi:hypothetical protein
VGITRVGYVTGVTTVNSTTVSVDASTTGRIAGDLLICLHGHGDSVQQTNPPVPTGFTRLGFAYINSTNLSVIVVGWKVSDGTETTTTFTGEFGVSASHAAGVVAFRGCRREAPSGGNFPNNTGTNSVITAPTQTSVPEGGWTISVSEFGLTTPSTTCTVSGTNWSELFDVIGGPGASTYRNIVWADNSTNNGTVTGATFTYTSSGPRIQASSFYLIPATIGSPLIMSM